MFRLVPVEKFKTHVFRDFAQLKSIWAPDLLVMAEDATKDFETSLSEPGEILLICFLGEVVGITGWWPISENEAGLRWHGIVPRYRNIGFGGKALDLLCARIGKFKSIHEVAFTENAAKYFERAGFVRESNEQTIHRCIQSAGGGEIVLSRAVLPNAQAETRLTAPQEQR